MKNDAKRATREPNVPRKTELKSIRSTRISMRGPGLAQKKTRPGYDVNRTLSASIIEWTGLNGPALPGMPASVIIRNSGSSIPEPTTGGNIASLIKQTVPFGGVKCGNYGLSWQ